MFLSAFCVKTLLNRHKLKVTANGGYLIVGSVSLWLNPFFFFLFPYESSLLLFISLL